MIVLDTHIWVWLNTSPKAVPEHVLAALKGNELVVSAISLWETALLLEKGRVQSGADPDSTVRTWMNANPFKIVPVDSEIALLSRALPFNHEDPADRFIAATAHSLGVPLATMDERLLRLTWLQTL